MVIDFDLSSLLEKADSQISTLIAIQDILPRLITSEIQRLRYTRNAAAPISRLPNEVLVRAFAESVAHRYHERYDERPRQLATLSSVSKAWNHVVQNTPSLWANVDSKQPLAFVRAALARSRRYPLDARAALDDGNDDAEKEAALEICGELHRWQTAELTASKASDFDVVAYTGAPILKSITMSATDNDRRVRLFNDVVPELEHISLTNLSIDWTSPILSRLRSIALSGIAGPTHHQFLHILRSSPHLTKLTLKQFRLAETDGTHAPLERISLPLLRTLLIQFCPDDVINTCAEWLRCPVLDDVYIAGEDSGNPAPAPLADLFEPSFRRSSEGSFHLAITATVGELYVLKFAGPNGTVAEVLLLFDTATQVLEHLRPKITYSPTTIRISHMKRRPLHKVLKAFPDVVGLNHIYTAKDNITYLGTPVTKGGVIQWPAPKLKALVLHKLSFEKPQDVVDLIRSRSGGNHLDRDDPMELPDALEQLCLTQECNMGRIAYLRLRAMLGEGRVEWEGAEMAS